MLSESKATHAEQLEQSRKQLDKVMSPCHIYLGGRWSSTTGCTLSISGPFVLILKQSWHRFQIAVVSWQVSISGAFPSKFCAPRVVLGRCLF